MTVKTHLKPKQSARHRAKFSAKQRWPYLAVACVFAIAGVFFVFKSFAANPNLPGDIDNNNKVDLADLSQLLSKWNSTDTNSDVNGDGKVGLPDLSLLLSNWNKTYTPTNPPNTPPTPPVVGNTNRASGLPWSSGVWMHGSASFANTYVSVARGGVPLDNAMEYSSRANQSDAIASVGRMSMPTGFNPARDDLVISATTWTADGASMTGAQGQQFGAAACKIDPTPIVRLDWEMNLPGGPGHNGAELNSGNYSQWVARWRAAGQGMKTGCPGLRLDFNPNNGPDQTSGCANSDPAKWCSRRAFQELKDLITFFGIDTYDAWQTFEYMFTGIGHLNDSYQFAIANGKKFTVPEWGLWKAGAVENARGDDPIYINRMTAWFNERSANIGYETYFSEPASYIVSDLVGSNPNSRAAMASNLKQYSVKY